MVFFQEYRAIIYYHGNPEKVPSLVALHPQYPTRLYWSGGMAYAEGSEGTHYQTLKRYKVADFQTEGMSNGEAEDAIELQFYREFCVPQLVQPYESAGWIAPNGEFYPCGHQEHDSLAVRLSAWFYSSLSGTALLEQHKWLRLESTGLISRLAGYNGQLTQQQLDTLAMLQHVSSGEFQRSITHELQRAVV